MQADRANMIITTVFIVAFLTTLPIFLFFFWTIYIRKRAEVKRLKANLRIQQAAAAAASFTQYMAPPPSAHGARMLLDPAAGGGNADHAALLNYYASRCAAAQAPPPALWAPGPAPYYPAAPIATDEPYHVRLQSMNKTLPPPSYHHHQASADPALLYALGAATPALSPRGTHHMVLEQPQQPQAQPHQPQQPHSQQPQAQQPQAQQPQAQQLQRSWSRGPPNHVPSYDGPFDPQVNGGTMGNPGGTGGCFAYMAQREPLTASLTQFAQQNGGDASTGGTSNGACCYPVPHLSSLNDGPGGMPPGTQDAPQQLTADVMVDATEPQPPAAAPLWHQQQQQQQHQQQQQQQQQQSSNPGGNGKIGCQAGHGPNLPPPTTETVLLEQWNRP